MFVLQRKGGQQYSHRCWSISHLFGFTLVGRSQMTSVNRQCCPRRNAHCFLLTDLICFDRKYHNFQIVRQKLSNNCCNLNWAETFTRYLSIPPTKTNREQNTYTHKFCNSIFFFCSCFHHSFYILSTMWKCNCNIN